MKNCIFALFLISGACFAQKITVAELQLKLEPSAKEELLYGFADGDRIVFTIEEANGAPVSEVSVMQYPDTYKYRGQNVKEDKKEFTVTVFAGDQTPVKTDANYFTDFLNQPTAVFLGIEKIARLIDSAVIFYDMKRVKRGYYTYTIVPLVENTKSSAEYEITEAHVKYLEMMIRREPQYWLWSHRRWKFKPEQIN